MPFKSKRQAKWMFWAKPELAKEFARKTLSIKKLPEKIKNKKSK
jgi:hypothetical protein